MSEPAADLARRDPDALDKIMGTGDTRAMLEQVERNVRDVIEVARDRGFVTRFNQRDFFGFPAWSLLALTYGLVPFVEWTKPVDGGWEARAVVRTRTGDVVSSAEAMCTRKEQPRRSADDHTLRAMAQTRAMRNALRSCLGAALVLAGFDFADPEGPATKEQVGLLHQLERELGLDHDQGHLEAGVDSYKDLNREDASTLIDRWTALRDQAQDGSSQASSPDAPASARPDDSGARTAPDTEAPGDQETTLAYGEGAAAPTSPGVSTHNDRDDEPASEEQWQRAPHHMNRVGAIKLARKLIDAGRILGPAPTQQSQFTRGQLAAVITAYLDGERG